MYRLHTRSVPFVLNGYKRNQFPLPALKPYFCIWKERTISFNKKKEATDTELAVKKNRQSIKTQNLVVQVRHIKSHKPNRNCKWNHNFLFYIPVVALALLICIQDYQLIVRSSAGCPRQPARSHYGNCSTGRRRRKKKRLPARRVVINHCPDGLYSKKGKDSEKIYIARE